LLLLLLLVAAAAAAALGPVTGVSAAADIPARPGGAGNWNPLPGGDVGTAAGQAPGTLDSCGPPLALAAVLLPAGGLGHVTIADQGYLHAGDNHSGRVNCRDGAAFHPSLQRIPSAI